MEEVITKLEEAIQGVEAEIKALRKLGTRQGSIESYPKGERTYYNYVRYQRGKPTRKYLPLSQKPKLEAEIERGREVARLKIAISLLQEVRQLLDQ